MQPPPLVVDECNLKDCLEIRSRPEALQPPPLVVDECNRVSTLEARIVGKLGKIAEKHGDVVLDVVTAPQY